MEAAGKITVEEPGEGVAVVALSGEHDLSTVELVKAGIAEARADDRAVVVDLTGASFVDSSILGAVLDARRTATEDALGFAVAMGDGAEAVRRVLEVTGLNDELPVHASRDAAIQAANPHGAQP